METLQRTANRGSVSTGFDVDNGTAFDRTRSEYYTRDVSSAGSRTKGTISMWAKRGILNVTQYLFEMGNVDNDDGRLFARFGSDNTLRLATGSTTLRNTVRVFRDSSAWYHFLVVIDTTQSTANDRVKLYVNGVQETIFSTTNNYSEDGTSGLNFGRQVIGYSQIDSAGAYDGNICEVVIQDGVTSAPTDFGEFTDTGQWIPIDPSGVTFGTNGCYLDFEDSSNMGNDKSGGTDFTENNINSLDQSQDTCTNNFSTLNFNTAVLQGNNGNTGGGFSGGNILRQGIAGDFNAATGTQGINPFVDAKWYFEVESTATSNGSSIDVGYGWIGESLMLSASHANTDVYSAGTIRYVSQTAHSGGDIQSVLFEGGTTPVIKFYRNDGLVHTATHGTDWTAKDEFMFPYVAVKGSGQEGVMNFGNPIQENAVASANADPNGYGNFEFATKSGYALNSKNLAEYASLTSVDDPSEYCQSIYYNGTGGLNLPVTITNTGNADLQPDLIWFFEFSAGYGTAAMDSSRGRAKVLYPSDVNAEVSSGVNDDLVSFDSDGFKVGAPSNANSTNGGTTQKLALQWKANAGSTSSFTESGNNPGGTIQTNTSAGFSIISYTGTGGPGNIAHGLPSAPELVIFKNRGTTNVWATYHVGLGDDLKLELNSNNAKDADGSFMNSTIPDATNIRAGDSNNPNTNADTGTYICYAWSPIKGYSKFGFYEGIGSSDPENAFVYTGFTPRHVWIKRIDGTGNWVVHDISLGTKNGTGTIKGNFGNAQTAALRIDDSSSGIDDWGDIDIFSNGFCCRSAAGATCANGGDYVYAAWAFNPFITSSDGGSHPSTAV